MTKNYLLRIILFYVLLCQPLIAISSALSAPANPSSKLKPSADGTNNHHVIARINSGVINLNKRANQVPVAGADAGITTIGNAIIIDAPANDTDPDGTLDLTTVLLIDPADNVKKNTVTIAGQGTYTVNAANGKVTFTPVAAFMGKTTPIAYTIKDNLGGESASALISIAVKPVAVSDVDATPISTPVATTVKTNDGASGTGTNVVATTPPTYGTVFGNSSGNITYIPNIGYVGKDTYKYVLSTADGVLSDAVTVTISVKPVGTNDVDIAAVNTAVTTAVKANDGPSATGTTVTAGTPPAHGGIVVSASGAVTYTPNAGYTGVDTYIYTLNTADGVVSDPITVTIIIGSKPVGVNDADVTFINTAVITNVTANDPDGPGSTVIVVSSPSKGVAIADPLTGKVTYTPDADFIGKDSYTYSLINVGIISDPITVNISVKPVGVNDNDFTPINVPVTTNVKANDGASIIGTTMAIKTAPAHGSVVIDAAGTITYTPASNYTGKDSYTYTLTTGDGVVSDPITVYISDKPVGVNDVGLTLINTPITTTVKANDGASATGTTVTAGTAPAHGTIVVNASGTISYTPATGYTGTDSYTYTLVTADGVVSDPITVTITVVNKPMGVADAVVTTINTAVTSPVTANDPDGPGSTVAIVSPASHGTLTIDATGNVTYTPATNYIGRDSYTYTITNGGFTSDPITVSVSVKPVGVNDTDLTLKNTPVTTTVKTNDGASGTGTTVTAGTAPTHGTILVNAGGTITYTPTASYTGTDSYTYRLVTADGVSSDPITVNLTIANKPVGVNDVVVTTINTPVTTTVTANDPDGAGSTVTIVTTTTHGTLVVDPVTGKVTYTPANNYVGKDTYTYTITNGGVTSDPITVSISVKPVGVNDTDITLKNTPVTTTVKTNDGPSGTGTTVTAGTAPVHGSIVVNAGGIITYTPTAGYTGTDTYTYTLVTADGVASDPITVTITIGNKPVGVNDVVVTPVNTPVTTTVTANDPDGAGSTVTVVGTPAHGTITVDATGKVTYTPANNYMGKDTYTYTLTNGGFTSDPITVTVNVKPVGVNDVDLTLKNIPVTTTVVTNDGVSGVGTIVTAGTAPAHGSIVVNASGTITYTPAAGYTGPDTYTYTLVTADGVVSDPITVSITVGNKPVGVNDVVTTPINTPVTTPITANDPDGAGAVITIVSQTTHGSITLDAATGNVTYIPNNNYMGKDTYTYTITKGGFTSDPITVTINVKPLGVNDVDLTLKNTPVITSVIANDGVSGIGTTVTAGTAPAHGSIVVNASGTITYTPTSGYTGTDTYTYRLVTADGVVSDPVTVTITVGNKPVGINDVVVTYINVPAITPVTTNDPDGAGAIVTIAGQAAHGTLLLDPITGKVTYTPANNYMGKDSYTYTITKGGFTSDPITVNIIVKPVGVNDTDLALKNTPLTTTVTTNDGASAVGTTVTAATPPAHGTIVVNASGTITYTPTTGYVGADSYTYTLVTADGVVSDPITVTLTVANKPVGLNDVVVTTINTPVTTAVAANDPDGPGSTVTIASQASHGTLAVDATGKVTYTPNNNYMGKDSYTYILTNGGIPSNPITVSISVKPVGVNDADATPVNTAVTTTVTTNDGASATGTTVTAGTPPAHGTIVINATGGITYTPATGYIGSDTYTYTLVTNDGVSSDPITVTINSYNASMKLTKVANNSGNKTGDVINYTLVVTNTGTIALSNIIVADAGADVGSISPATIASLAAGASATVTARHTLTQANVDAGLYSNQASVSATDTKGNTVTKPLSDNPATPAADDPTVVNIPAAAAFTLTKTGVFSANIITYSFVIKNTGNVTLNTITLTDAKLALNNVAVTVPAGGLLPGASITYTAIYTLTQADKDAGIVTNIAAAGGKDPAGHSITSTSGVIITVPKSPVAVDDALKAYENQPTTIQVLANDNSGSAAFNTSSVEIMTQPTHGTVRINNDGSVTYTSKAGYAGADSFTYRVRDTYGYYSNVATVSLTVVMIKPMKIPTLFTPNGDGRNDTFLIVNLDQYAQSELTIVNRYGSEVYKQTGYQNTWTGDGLNEGTYYYLLRVKITDEANWDVFKGYITLIRAFKK